MPDAYTKLIPELGDGDPDDAFSSVPYEKGFNLLYSLETMVGKDAFAKFTKAYFNEFKFGVVTSQKFREFFNDYFKDDPKVMTVFDWDTWLHKPGMPAKPDFDRTLSAACEDLADGWMAVEGDAAKVPTVDITNWNTSQRICFLDALLAKCSDRNEPLSLETVGLMKEAYKMHETHNSEVLHRFCMISVAAGDASIIPVVLRFITTQGRMKFVRPLYRALFASKMGKNIAVKTFFKHRDFYHPVCAKMLAKDLEIGDDDAESDVKRCGSSQRHFVLGALVVVASAIGIALIRGKRR
jgi:leukotriene-A4 hydrolase